MVGCAALNCTSSTEKGHTLFSFPRDAVRRKLWLKSCGKVRTRNGKPYKIRKLCAVHFADDQFERARADGLRKLRPNAVPTIFFYDRNCCISPEITVDVKTEEKVTKKEEPDNNTERTAKTQIKNKITPDDFKNIVRVNIKSELREEIEMENPDSSTTKEYEMSNENRQLETSSFYINASLKNRFQCPHCIYEPDSENDLESHILVEHKEALRYLECRYCPFKTQFISQFKTHTTTQHNLPEVTWYICKYCTYKTKKRQYLAQHCISKHSELEVTNTKLDVWRYECDHCRYKTNKKNSLDLHLFMTHLEKIRLEKYAWYQGGSGGEGQAV